MGHKTQTHNYSRKSLHIFNSSSLQLFLVQILLSTSPSMAKVTNNLLTIKFNNIYFEIRGEHTAFSILINSMSTQSLQREISKGLTQVQIKPQKDGALKKKKKLAEITKEYSITLMEGGQTLTDQTPSKMNTKKTT